VLLFSLPDCPYCKVVRRNYLGPMLREPNPPVIRELTMTSRQSIRDYDGATTTPAALARRYGVAVAPTLVFVDADGEMLSDPLVGGDNQFYMAYLDRAFDDSHKKLAANKRRGH
jgi:thioredoxin-related protein